MSRTQIVARQKVIISVTAERTDFRSSAVNVPKVKSASRKHKSISIPVMIGVSGCLTGSLRTDFCVYIDKNLEKSKNRNKAYIEEQMRKTKDMIKGIKGCSTELKFWSDISLCGRSKQEASNAEKPSKTENPRKISEKIKRVIDNC